MQPLSSAEQRRLLDETYTATLCTTNPNGTINAIPIWYRYDGEAFWIVTDAKGRKTRNLERDPRVSLSLLITKTETTKTVIGLVYGTATIHHLPLAELQARAAWIFDKYVDEAGVRQRVEPMDTDVAVALEIRPDKLRTWHP
jgi:PPOX class probable F420-dependent enzyme